MKTKSLHISIPNPCSQNWQDMKADGSGRLCTQCSKTIYDFSLMSDTEVFAFFKNYPETSCGRFHITQLNRDIEPVKTRKGLNKWFMKMAAAFFAFVSLKAAAQAPVKQKQQTEATPVKLPLGAEYSSSVISGKVTDTANKPLEGVKVSIGRGVTLERGRNIYFTTGPDGYYSINTSCLDIPKNASILFSKDGYIHNTIVYDSVSNKGGFDVVMMPLSALKNRVVLGMFGYSAPLFPYLNIDKPEITGSNKDVLLQVTDYMKNRPGTNFQITVLTGENCVDISSFHKRGNIVLNFLTENAGITAERLSIVDKPSEDSKKGFIKIEKINSSK